MTDNNEHNNEQASPAPERKKVSLQDAINQKLASKKQEQAVGKTKNHAAATAPTMKSQLSKKPNNQRRRMGV